MKTMQFDRRSIIVSTPEEILSLLIEALRTLGYEKTESGNEHRRKKLLTPKEVEKEFGFRVKTLAYWRLAGIGPVYMNCGRHVYYERAVLEEYLRAGRIQTSDSQD